MINKNVSLLLYVKPIVLHVNTTVIICQRWISCHILPYVDYILSLWCQVRAVRAWKKKKKSSNMVMLLHIFSMIWCYTDMSDLPFTEHCLITLHTNNTALHFQTVCSVPMSNNATPILSINFCGEQIHPLSWKQNKHVTLAVWLGLGNKTTWLGFGKDNKVKYITFVNFWICLNKSTLT